MTSDRLQCAVLTPPGRGAVATVGVRGHAALAAVARRFRPASGRALESYPAGRILFGRFQLADGLEEELVVGLVSADQVEVHCHGGAAVVQAIAEALVAAGCRLIDDRQWAACEQPDAIAAAALLALGQARTERTAAVLLDQYRGALRVAVAEEIRHLASGEGRTASAALERLLSRRELGLHLTAPWKVVLAGRPNAGKSSLMNCIIGYERAIVFEQPGTTRDVLTASTAIDGWPIELADTAGLRAAEGAIETEGIERAWAEISAADAVLLVADTTAVWDAELFVEVAKQAKRVLVVHTKCDLQLPSDGRSAGIAVSAKNGSGIEALCGGIAELLVPDPPLPGEAVPFTDGQIQSFREAAGSMDRGDLPTARDALQAILQPRATSAE